MYHLSDQCTSNKSVLSIAHYEDVAVSCVIYSEGELLQPPPQKKSDKGICIVLYLSIWCLLHRLSWWGPELIMGSCNTRHIFPFSKVGGSGENTILTWQQQTRPHNMRNQNYPTEFYREGSIFWDAEGNHSAWRKAGVVRKLFFDGVVQLEV